MTTDLHHALEELTRRLDAASIAAGLRPYSQQLHEPAHPSVLDRAEHELERLLPAEVRDLFAWHDGAELDLAPSCYFQGLSNSVSARRDLLQFPMPRAANAAFCPDAEDLLPIFSTDGADYCVELSNRGSSRIDTTSVYYLDLERDLLVQMATTLRAFIVHITLRLDDPGLERRPYGLDWVEADWLIWPSQQMDPWN
jgi:hypothetical protein